MTDFWYYQFEDRLPSIDLHGSESVVEALEELERELFLMYQKKIKTFRVIYGIGEGKMQKEVLKALTKNPLVLDYRQEPSGGSSIVFI